MSKISKDKRFDVLTQYNGRCAYCAKFGELTIDHLIPVSRGGRSVYHNLAPACVDCNQAKDDMTVDEFRKEIRIRKLMLSFNRNLKQPLVARQSIHWQRVVKRFETPVVFWLDNH